MDNLHRKEYENRYVLRADVVGTVVHYNLIDVDILDYEDLTHGKPLPTAVGSVKLKKEFDYWDETIRGQLAVGEYPLK